MSSYQNAILFTNADPGPGKGMAEERERETSPFPKCTVVKQKKIYRERERDRSSWVINLPACNCFCCFGYEDDELRGR